MCSKIWPLLPFENIFENSPLLQCSEDVQYVDINIIIRVNIEKGKCQFLDILGQY